MNDIRKLERSIIHPNLMCDFLSMSDKKEEPLIRVRDIIFAIFLALVIMQ